MAAKKIKAGQEAKAPEIPAPESQAVDNLEIGEGVGKKPNAEDGEDTEPDPGAGNREDAGQDMETVEDSKEKPLPKVLAALRPILYLARQYEAGDSLPVNNQEMVEAWIEAGSAEWREEKGGRFFP